MGGGYLRKTNSVCNSCRCIDKESLVLNSFDHTTGLALFQEKCSNEGNADIIAIVPALPWNWWMLIVIPNLRESSIP